MKQEQHFSYPLDLAAFVRGRLTELHARAPALAALEEILEVAFFASMKTEESEPVLCTLAYVDMKNPDPMPPERIVADRWSYVRFEQPIPLDVKNLVKVSKSIDSAFAALAVCRDSNERLVIWGAIDQQGQRAAFTSRKADEGPESPGLLQRRRPDLSIALEVHNHRQGRCCQCLPSRGESQDRLVCTRLKCQPLRSATIGAKCRPTIHSSGRLRPINARAGVRGRWGASVTGVTIGYANG